jgi:hypothetical protein
MDRRQFLMGLSAACAVAASGLELKMALAEGPMAEVHKIAKVRHLMTHDIYNRVIHRFDILIGPGDRVDERTTQYGVDVWSDSETLTRQEIEPALEVLADKVEQITGGRLTLEPLPVADIDSYQRPPNLPV